MPAENQSIYLERNNTSWVGTNEIRAEHSEQDVAEKAHKYPQWVALLACQQ